MNNENLLVLKDIVKVFPGVRAVDHVDWAVAKGEVHALLGHNGAGKSTLVKIISGAYQRDSGQMLFDGKDVCFSSPHDALESGIGMVYQELDLVPHLDGSENIFLGQNRFCNKLGFINKKERLRAAQELLQRMNVQIDLTVPVKDLSISKQQLIAIAKAISRDAKLIIFDEPTAALNNAEVQKLFEVMRMLTKRGLSLVLITHRLDEVFEICDRVTLMRDGKRLSTDSVNDITMEKIVCAMTGAEEGVQEAAEKECFTLDKVALSCSGLSGAAFHNISFDLHAGEALGITGLIGCGSTEIAKALFGAYPINAGEVSVNGKPLGSLTPYEAVKNRIAYVSEDRKGDGLNLIGSVGNNISLPILDRLSHLGFVQRKTERQEVARMIDALRIRVSSQAQLAGTLSGGNQQKVVLAKWLLKNPNVFIMCEPTRGIDVGAKREIHRIIRELVSEGDAVLVVSSEAEEVMDVCDRVLVLYEGSVKAEANINQLKKADLLNLMYGVS